MPIREKADEERVPNYDIEPLLYERWSLRAMNGEPLEEPEFMPLLEAARWAPSSYNSQHWRFHYATPETEMWEDVLDLLSEGNRRWASDAGLLVVFASKTTYDERDGHVRRRQARPTGNPPG